MGNKCSSCCTCCACCKCTKGHYAPNQDQGGNKDPQEDFPRPPTEIPLPLIQSPEDSVLVVQKIDFHISENVALHHTDKYDHCQLENQSKQKLILRRGQPFQLTLEFNRTYNQERDAVCLVFRIPGTHPSYGQGTLISVPVLDEILNPIYWGANITKQENKSLILNVVAGCDCIVGIWNLDVDTKLLKTEDERMRTLRYGVADDIFILFNPWCKEDQVYMANEDWRNEYVLNDSGLIWRGSHELHRPCAWLYGQFEKNILDCSIKLIVDKGLLSVSHRADPIHIVRHLSAVVNSPDDKGVLVGNWSDDYSGGIKPTLWNGSVQILKSYYTNGFKSPIKFGQCWVFSGVITSICRALGIPCRPVTNFLSAHDTHNSLTIDHILDKEGVPIESLNNDSVWSFHVWNECWMQRPDLEPGGYGGWQIVDATPQELSDGMFRCGPASVKAIKNAEIRKPYDGPFAYSEINADRVLWQFKGPTEPLLLLNVDETSIGQFISTKSVGSLEREDITHTYKYGERTAQERAVMLRALKQSNHPFSRYYTNQSPQDIDFELELLDDVVIGCNFNVVLKMKNQSTDNTSRHVFIILRVDSMLYTGTIKNMVKSDQFEVTLQPSEAKEAKMVVSFNEYYDKLADQASFNISALAKVTETKKTFCTTDDFRIRMPDIKLETEGELRQGNEFICHLNFSNPMPKILHNAHFVVEGPGLGTPRTLNIQGVIQPNSDVSSNCKLKPSTSGEKIIVAKFISKELNDIDGHLKILVEPKENS